MTSIRSTATRATATQAHEDTTSALGLFVRRWLADPIGIGALVPSAPALAAAMARQARRVDAHAIVELGPGTGAVTRALLARGIPQAQLVLIERDREMHAYLRQRFPAAQVILADAMDLATVLPQPLHGQIASVLSSLPLIALPPERRCEVLSGAFSVLAPQGTFAQYTYGHGAPIDATHPGLVARRVERIWHNLPPATVWCYSRAQTAH